MEEINESVQAAEADASTGELEVLRQEKDVLEGVEFIRFYPVPTDEELFKELPFLKQYLNMAKAQKKYVAAFFIEKLTREYDEIIEAFKNTPALKKSFLVKDPMRDLPKYGIDRSMSAIYTKGRKTGFPR